MIRSQKNGFKTIETDPDEFDEKIRSHRRKVWRRTIGIIAVVVLVMVGVNLWTGLRSYDSYEVEYSEERADTEATRFETFGNNILRYSNDGAAYSSMGGELIWNKAFEMTNPKVVSCGDYVAIYDQGGTSIYIMTTENVQKAIETTMAIQKVDIANQGTIAVLMKEDAISYVKLFDKKGKELAGGEFYGEQGGFPVDIALSDNAQKLAVAMINVNDGNIKSTISFYNFGSVGQNEIDNNVGTYSYSDLLIPHIEYVSDERMVAFGDDEIVIFGGAQKPKVEQEIFLSQEIESLFFNNKYIGILYTNPGEDVSHHIKVFDMKGSVIMENDTTVAYSNVEFLANNEICITNDYEMELYTVHSIKKFAQKFDTKLYKVLSGGTSRAYTLIMDGETQEVKLK